MLINEKVKNRLRKCMELVQIKSLEAAAREQQLDELAKKLQALVPDLTDQYTSFKVKGRYLNTKVRNMHAFQISLIDEIINEFQGPIIVDIGDSSGTHLQYIAGLYSQNKNIKCLSVNLDPKAVDRIQKKGFEAIHTRAEDLHKRKIFANIFVCFEILEHLVDPCRFLYDLSSKTDATYFIVTVPYLKNSRVGLHHIRAGREDYVNAENTHILELSTEDWKLLAIHAGWTVVEDRIYLQYPKKSIWRLAKLIWKKYDFEGFYGLILKKDSTWSSRYADW